VFYGFEGFYDFGSYGIKEDVSIMLKMCGNIVQFVSSRQNLQDQ
jgi:hypothetical protein